MCSNIYTNNINTFPINLLDKCNYVCYIYINILIYFLNTMSHKETVKKLQEFVLFIGSLQILINLYGKK